MFYAAAVAVLGFSASRSLSYSLIFFFNLSQVYVGGRKPRLLLTFIMHFVTPPPPVPSPAARAAGPVLYSCDVKSKIAHCQNHLSVRRSRN